jgi:hypothetical protein
MPVQPRPATPMQPVAGAADIAPVTFELQAAGVTSPRGIAAALNDRGIPTASGRGAGGAHLPSPFNISTPANSARGNQLRQQRIDHQCLRTGLDFANLYAKMRLCDRFALRVPSSEHRPTTTLGQSGAR